MTDWPVKTLGELFEFKNGRGFKKTEWSTSGLPIIRIQNLNSDSASYNHFSGTFDAGILVDPGDLLFSWSGSIGTSFGPHIWRRSSGLLNQHIFKVSPKVPIDTDYAHYCLRVITAEIERSVNGAVGLVHITKEKLNKFEIPVPPIDEQKRIVELLDAATARVTELTACYEQARTHANNLFTSALRDALEGNPDWPVKTLGEVAVVNPSEPALSEEAPFVPMDAVTAGKRDVQYTQPRGQRSGARARAGDILFARITPCLQNGKVALVQDKIERCGGSTEFIVVRAGPEVLNGYLYQWITAEHIRDHVTALMKGATGRQRLNAEDLALTELPVPPLAEQKQIVARLDLMRAKTSEMVAAYDAKLQAAKDLRQSILEAAFAGDL